MDCELKMPGQSIRKLAAIRFRADAPLAAEVSGRAAPIVQKYTGIAKKDVSVILMGSSVANRFALRHHYLQRKRAGKCVCYAVLLKGYFEGILIFAWPPVSHPMFGYKPGRIVELARVWFEHNPKNLGSCAIRMALRRLPHDWPGTEAVVSWCDLSRFDGAIYKATGFEYMGKSRVRAREASAAKYQGGRAGREVQPDRFTQKDIYLIRLKGKE